MNSLIELHDTSVESVLLHDGDAVVIFAPAYIHRSLGKPGVDVGTGWTQTVRLTFEETRVSGSVPELPEHLSSGELRLKKKRCATTSRC